MTDASVRFFLPFIMPGQAQKEVYHNEALVGLDAALHPSVETAPLAIPPSDPGAGQCWIVGAGATGAWVGFEDSLACWTPSGWRFVAPVPGMLVWNIDIGCWLYWSGSMWSDGELPATAIVIAGEQVVGPRLSSVPSPSGGTTIDAEARSAIDALIVTLRSHGLID